MGRVVLTAPDPSIGLEFINQARELLALGYPRPAAMMARLSIEAAVVTRLAPTVANPERRRCFTDLIKRMRRGCSINHDNGRGIERTYRALSKFAHVDTTPRDAAELPNLIELAETFRQLVATAEASYEAASALEVHHE